MRMSMSHVLLLAIVPLGIAGCVNSSAGADTTYFLSMEADSNSDEWLNSLTENRPVDMFFASHKTRPVSRTVDYWIIEDNPRFIHAIRKSLPSRVSQADLDAFFFIIEAIQKRSGLSSEELSYLRLRELCLELEPKVEGCELKVSQVQKEPSGSSEAVR